MNLQQTIVPGRQTVVMLSGGRDSVCLLDQVVSAAGADAVVALHCNYALREGADADETLCRELCNRLGVRLVVLRPRRPAGASGNLHAWAREVRYGAAWRLAGDDGLVLTGHTASDQAETVLYRLAASPGRRALLGMSPQQGRLVRPLLEMTREQTAEYCRERGLAWREDPSNDDPAYARARVRNDALEALRRVHPAAPASVVRTASELREEAEALDAVVVAELAGAQEITSQHLDELHPAIARLVVRRLAEQAAADPGRAAAVACRLGELRALTRSSVDGGARELHVGGGLRAIAEYGVLRFAHGPPAGPLQPVGLTVPGVVRFGDYEVSSEVGWPAPVDGALDASVSALGLRVRSWRAGDRVRPAGRGGSRLVAELFAERRMPPERRHTLPLVEAGGELAWVPGIATEERFAVAADASDAVRLKLSGAV